MPFKLLILLCALSATLAYPYEPDFVSPQQELYYDDNFEAPVELPRFRRQLSGNVGGSPGQGFDVNLDARAPVWQSDNGRHQVDVNGGYSQHLGGPYGNSQPYFRGGATYTYRF